MAANPVTIPKTLVEKISDQHLVVEEIDGSNLLHVDRVFLDETAYKCLDELERLNIGRRYTVTRLRRSHAKYRLMRAKSCH